MKKLLLLITLLLSTVSAYGSSGHQAVDGDIKVTANPGKSGLTEVTFFLKPCSDRSKFTLQIVPKSALKYTGEQTIAITAQDRREQKMSFLFDVPPDDTTAFSFRIWEKGDLCTRSGGGARWFISTGDTLVMTASRPYPEAVYPYAAKVDSTPPVEHFPLSDTLLFRNPDIVVKNDSTGRVVIDSAATERNRGRDMTPYDPPKQRLPRDSVEKLIKARQQESLERAKQIEQVRRQDRRPDRGGTPQEQMERFIRNHPVAEAVEFVADGKVLWVRREGDSVFTVSTPINDRKAYREERAKRSTVP
jgi:hypothetical protein